MTIYRVLVIAPATDLALQADEVMQLVNILGAKLLQGTRANLHGLIDIFNSPWDIVWFASHGSAEGIHLSDGTLRPAEITPLLRTAGVQLTVMNTCESYEVAHAIHQELDTAFVCTVKPLPDRAAYLTASLFAQQLARGMPFRPAYEAAKPGQNSTYIYLEDQGPGMLRHDYPPHADEELLQIKDSLRRIEAIVTGNPQWNVYGLVPEVRDLRAKVETLIADIMTMRAHQVFNRRMLIFLSVICSGLLVTVAILLTQRGPLP